MNEVLNLTPPTPAMWTIILGMSILPFITTQAVTLSVVEDRPGCRRGGKPR
jgi:hypothetical protein